MIKGCKLVALVACVIFFSLATGTVSAKPKKASKKDADKAKSSKKKGKDIIESSGEIVLKSLDISGGIPAPIQVELTRREHLFDSMDLKKNPPNFIDKIVKDAHKKKY